MEPDIMGVLIGAVAILLLALLRCLGWLCFLLPDRARNALGAGLGRLFRLSKLPLLRGEVVRRNLEIAYPDNPQARQRLFHEAYAHLGRLFLEMLLLFGQLARFVRKHSEVEGLSHWTEARNQGRGVIFLSSHIGNWEVMAATGAMKGGVDLLMVTKHLKPEWLHQAVEKSRLACGVKGTYEPRTMRDILSHLKRNGTVGFVLDQYAGAPIGVRVPFFGAHVGTPTTVATLAKRTGAAVLPALNYRMPNGRFKCVMGAPIPWESHEDAAFELAANTARYAQCLESHIRAHPEQWLWTHRRFKGDLSPLRPGEWSLGRARK